MKKKKPVKRGPVTSESDKFILRLPDGMRAALAELAARNGRSMNSEVVEALSLHFERPKDSGAADRHALKEMFEDLIREIATEVVTSGGSSPPSSGSKVRGIIREIATEVVNEFRKRDEDEGK